MNTMVELVIAHDVYLPRFTLKKGDVWRLCKSKITHNGVAIGGGFVPCDAYKVKEIKSK